MQCDVARECGPYNLANMWDANTVSCIQLIVGARVQPFCQDPYRLNANVTLLCDDVIDSGPGMVTDAPTDMPTETPSISPTITSTGLVERDTQIIRVPFMGIFESNDTVCFNVTSTCIEPTIVVDYVPNDFDNTESDEFLDVK